MPRSAQNRWRPGGAAQPLLAAKKARELVERGALRLNLARSELQMHVAESGLGVSQQYTRAVDETIVFLRDEVARLGRSGRRAMARIALAAQGGYGRCELNLYSDIDLLAIVPDDVTADEERAVTQLFHLLWDLHLDLGHATKTVGECLDTLGTDIDSATALIEARFLAGNREVFGTMREQFEQRLRRRRRRWFLGLRQRDWDERHEHFGESVYMLEPNVKEGEGSLRDVHTLRWLEFVLFGETSLEALEREGMISAAERSALLEGVDFLLRVRNLLHVLEGRKCDLLSFAKQPRVAQALGYAGDGTALAEELLMRDFYIRAREVFRIADRVVTDLTEPRRRKVRSWSGRGVNKHLRCRRGRLHVYRDEAAYFEGDPARLATIFATSMQIGCRVSEPTKRTIEQLVAQGIGAAIGENPEAHDALLSILAAPGGVGRTLRDMHECGVLGLCLPEFRRLFCMVRADQYHRYTVDEHSIRAVETADKVRAGDESVPKILRSEAESIIRWDLLNLAILIHDIGKGEGHGHVRLGGQIAQRISARFQLPADEADIVRRLVLDHLKLSHTAQRRDLEDAKVIERIARGVGDVDYLRMLYVLTYCDLRAVSPRSWTDWKSALLAELFDRTAATLAGRPPNARARGPSSEETLSRVREHLTAPEEEHPIPLSEYIAELPDRYLATTDPELVAHHYEMLGALDEENRVVWELRRPPGANYSELTVVAYDRAGVFSVLCGALASKRINILGAQVFSTRGGGVIDRFQIQDDRAEPLPEGFVLDRLRNDVNRIFCGRKSVGELFEQTPRRKSEPRPELKDIVPPVVLVDNEGSDHSTIIEVKGYDRIGFLYDVTAVFSRHGLSIDRALIATEAYRVVDVFYVTDSEEKKLDDPGAIDRLQKELLEVISP